MKKLFILFSVLLSCIFLNSQQLYAKKDAKCAYVYFDSDDNWVIQDSLIKITTAISSFQYTDKIGSRTFTSTATVLFSLENLSDEILYVDLGSSFIIRNQLPEMLWNNSQHIVTEGKSTGASVNIGAITNAMGIGGSIGSLANGVSVGGSNSTSQSTLTQQERILRLPPFSSQTFMKNIFAPGMGGLGWKKEAKWRILNTLTFYAPNIKKAGDILTFNDESSPIKIRLFIKYSADESFINTSKISTSFYSNLLVGTADYPGGKKALKELNEYGFGLEKPYIGVLLCK